ncbi:MAG: hypothetical protein RLZZ303_980 [Candidatus Hydrogenedentota bacterium]
MRWPSLASRRRTRLSPARFLAVGLAVLASACHESTQENSKAPTATGTPEREDATESRSAPQDQGIIDALALWRTGQQQQAMIDVQALAERSASLRVYRLSEPEYAALPHSTQIETLESMLEVSNALSALGRGMVAAGQEARASGDAARARRMLAAALKLGQDNMGPPDQIVVQGNLIGKKIADAAAAELKQPD